MAKTYSDIFINIRNKLRDNGISNYSFEARQLVCCVTKKSNEEFMRDMALYASSEIEEKSNLLLNRRLNGEPLAYITNVWEFYGLPMFVTPDVLIPRIDTEILVETALNKAKKINNDLRILDLCTGSGCIGCALSKNLPNAKIISVDISAKALQICRKNAILNNVQHNMICMQADAKNKVPVGIGYFDFIVCNPPYISAPELMVLDPSVRDYEPLWALDGGLDGLDFYRCIIKNWKQTIKPGGFIIFEVGEGQADEVKNIFLQYGYKNIETYKDTINVDRVIYGEV